MRVLHVIKDCPYPPDGGFQSDIWNRLVAMSSLGYRVLVLVTTRRNSPSEDSLAEVRKFAERVGLVPRALSLSSIFTPEPTLVATNHGLSKVAVEGEYDLAIADSEELAPIFDNPRLTARLRVVRVHNDESRYYSMLARAEERPCWKAFFALEALRFRWFSRRLFGKVDGIWFISKLEHDRITSRYPELRPKCCWIPPAIELRATDLRSMRRTPAGKEVLFVGDLSNSLNREGIRWYVGKVHPALMSDPEYRLIVAGATRGSASAKAFAAEITAVCRCEVHTDLKDIGPLYERARAVVNPMQHGGGVKLKTIHAVQRCVPLVTTGVGAEGSGFMNLDHLRIEDDPNGFAKAIRDIFDHPEEAKRMTERAYRFLCENYDQAAHIRRFLAEHLPVPVDGPGEAAPQPTASERPSGRSNEASARGTVDAAEF